MSDGLELSEDQRATFEFLQTLRQQAGEHEDAYTKLSLIKAKHQGELTALTSDCNALANEVHAYKKRAEKCAREQHDLQTRIEEMQQARRVAARNAAAAQHAVIALDKANKLRVADMQQYTAQIQARLAKEDAYVERQLALAAPRDEAAAAAEVSAERRHLAEQLRTARADRLAVDARIKAFVEEHFPDAQIPVMIAHAAQELFEDDTRNTNELAEHALELAAH